MSAGTSVVQTCDRSHRSSTWLRLLIWAPFAALVCTILAAVVVLATARRDPRVRLRDEIADAIGSPVLGGGAELGRNGRSRAGRRCLRPTRRLPWSHGPSVSCCVAWFPTDRKRRATRCRASRASEFAHRWSRSPVISGVLRSVRNSRRSPHHWASPPVWSPRSGTRVPHLVGGLPHRARDAAQGRACTSATCRMGRPST